MHRLSAEPTLGFNWFNEEHKSNSSVIKRKTKNKKGKIKEDGKVQRFEIW